MLLARDGDAGDPGASFFDGVFGKAAPTASDFQHMITGPDVGKIGKTTVFVGLRHRQIIAVGLEHGRGIGHRPVKPGGIEIIAEIIVVGNVPGRARFAVAAKPVEQSQAEPAPDIRRHLFRQASHREAPQARSIGHTLGLSIWLSMTASQKPILPSDRMRDTAAMSMIVISARGPGFHAGELPACTVGKRHRQGARTEAARISQTEHRLFVFKETGHYRALATARHHPPARPGIRRLGTL